jgi:hypothetical protein
MTKSYHTLKSCGARHSLAPTQTAQIGTGLMQAVGVPAPLAKPLAKIGAPISIPGMAEMAANVFGL